MSRVRVRFGLALWLAGACVMLPSFAAAQAPYPPAAQRPGGRQSTNRQTPPRPASPAPSGNGPSVQLVAPTDDPADPAPPGNGQGGEVRFKAPNDGNIPPTAANADPTIPSPEVRQMLEAGSVNRTNNNQPAPSAALPPMSIKARVISRSKPPVAVIDVGGTPLTIHPGDTFAIGGATQGSGGLRLKVLDMTQSEIRFEVENRRQILTLN